MGKLDFKGLNEYALSNIDSVLHHYLPNGKHDGHEYKPFLRAFVALLLVFVGTLLP